MTVRVQVTDAQGEARQVELSAGEVLQVGPEEQVQLADLPMARVHAQITDTDLLALTVDGETMFLGGLSAHMESETGVSLTFADGETVDSLGALLAWLAGPESQAGPGDLASGASMADLVSSESDLGDLLYLDLGEPEAAEPSPAAVALSLDDVLQAPQDLAFATAAAGGEVIGSWADAEFAVSGTMMPALPGGDDLADIILPHPDGLV